MNRNKALGPISASVIVVTGLLVSGCTASSSDSYSRSDVGQIIETGYGTVVASRPVEVRDEGRGGLGTATGGVTGGIVGSTIGQGSGKTLATAAGALIGAGLGYLIEQELRSNSGMEYMVELEDGRTVTIVQNVKPDEEPIPSGTPVRVQYGANYTRITAATGAPATAGGTAGSSGDEWVNPDLNPGQSASEAREGDLVTSSASRQIVQ